ncbi:MAG: prepilin-type N-terminal cleavage/methylation domain-containing protein [Stellaceae bacterium]
MSPASIPPSRPSRRQPGAPGGFTLVELLVVLVIVALISGVLLTAFDRILDIRLRLATFLDGVEAPTLVADWFRSTVGGLVADTRTGAGHFTGDAHHLTGLTLAPLDAAAGVPTVITWEVVFDAGAGRTHLRYRDRNDRTMDIASWPGDVGGLRYCGPDFVCRDKWPPDKEASELPLLIRLDAVKGDEPWPILAAPRADRTPLRTSAKEP